MARDALGLVAFLAFGFVLVVTTVGGFQQSRDQQILLGQFRSDLANAVAPVSQTGVVDRALLAEGTPVALISLPTIGVEAVVAEGSASSVTTSGPGHRRDTVLPGQVGTSVVMGRQVTYGGVFGGLDRLAVGDRFTTTTGQGTATFEVTGRRLAGDPLPAAAPGVARMTLVTASGPAFLPVGVLQVDARLVSTDVDGVGSDDPFPTPARLFAAGSLGAEERAMAGDVGDLYPLVLWTQALLLALVLFVFARVRWGRWQAWVGAGPVVAVVGLTVASQTALLLPNVM